jgi:hypothetical protein
MAVVAAAVLGTTVNGASADTDDVEVDVRLSGYQEIPTLSTSGKGSLELEVDDRRIRYELSYRRLEGEVTQAHIHLGARAVNGGISAWLCQTSAAVGPTGTPTCPAPSGTVSGTITREDVIGPAGQGIDPGEFRELVRAIKAGAAYGNVHTSKYESGEIRGQLKDHDHHDHDHAG